MPSLNQVHATSSLSFQTLAKCNTLALEIGALHGQLRMGFNMKVKIECRKSKNYPNNVYATMTSTAAGELLVSATLDYCIARCAEMGLEITNAQDVLVWLHENADFKPYK